MTTVYLILSIVASTLINLIFRSFGNKVDKMSAIAINYIVCMAVALVVHGREAVFFTDFWNTDWFIYAASLGFMFIAIFYLIALTNQYSGVSVAAAASKLGVIIPVFAGIYLFNEEANLVVISAILISLVAVVLISRKDSLNFTGKYMWIILPMGVLIGSGIIDTMLKYIQAEHLGASNAGHPTTIIFGSAGLIGLLLALSTAKRRHKLFSRSSLVYGVVLGVPNYFSILFLLMALNTGELQSVVVFPLNNVGIVALSAIASILIYREKMSKGNIIGLILALIAIFIISRYR